MALHDVGPHPALRQTRRARRSESSTATTIDPRTCTLHDVYSVLGALGELSTRLQQATGQMADVLSARLAAGNLTLESGDVSALESLVRDCHDQLENAASAAGQLAISLRSAHQRVAAITDESDSAVQSAAPTRHAPVRSTASLEVSSAEILATRDAQSRRGARRPTRPRHVRLPRCGLAERPLLMTSAVWHPPRLDLRLPRTRRHRREYADERV